MSKKLYNVYNRKGTYLYSKMLDLKDAEHMVMHEDLVCECVENE